MTGFCGRIPTARYFLAIFREKGFHALIPAAPGRDPWKANGGEQNFFGLRAFPPQGKGRFRFPRARPVLRNTRAGVSPAKIFIF
jgi:hypothetical protein